jgi:hypothetical protein
MMTSFLVAIEESWPNGRFLLTSQSCGGREESRKDIQHQMSLFPLHFRESLGIDSHADEAHHPPDPARDTVEQFIEATPHLRLEQPAAKSIGSASMPPCTRAHFQRSRQVPMAIFVQDSFHPVRQRELKDAAG